MKKKSYTKKPGSSLYRLLTKDYNKSLKICFRVSNNGNLFNIVLFTGTNH